MKVGEYDNLEIAFHRYEVENSAILRGIKFRCNKRHLAILIFEQNMRVGRKREH